MGPHGARFLGGPTPPTMLGNSNNITVELSTPRGAVFTCVSSSIELRTNDGVIAITPREDSYLTMVHSTEITLRIGDEFKTFTLENARASLRKGHLVVLAEEINPCVAHVA